MKTLQVIALPLQFNESEYAAGIPLLDMQISKRRRGVVRVTAVSWEACWYWNRYNEDPKYYVERPDFAVYRSMLRAVKCFHLWRSKLANAYKHN